MKKTARYFIASFPLFRPLSADRGCGPTRETSAHPPDFSAEERTERVCLPYGASTCHVRAEVAPAELRVSSFVSSGTVESACFQLGGQCATLEGR